MTLNNKIMGQHKDCKQLDPERKFKIRVDNNGKILFVNKYFTEFTGYKIHELILKDFSKLFDSDMPKMALQLLIQEIELQPVTYFIYKGVNNDGSCYWALLRSTQNITAQNELDGYNFEVKLLPQVSIEKIDRIYDIVREIEKNAGLDAAVKYFEGYLEEKNMKFKDFILDATKISEKKAKEYFAIDIDSTEKKKKRSWF